MTNKIVEIGNNNIVLSCLKKQIDDLINLYNLQTHKILTF